MRGKQRLRVVAGRAQPRDGAVIGKGAGILLRPVDTVRIGGESRDAGNTLDAMRKRQKEFGVAPAAPAASAQRHRGFAARKQHDRLSERPVAQRHLTGNRRMNAAHLTRFALNRIRQDDGRHALRLGGGGSRFQRTRGRGDDMDLMTCKTRIIRLWRVCRR